MGVIYKVNAHNDGNDDGFVVVIFISIVNSVQMGNKISFQWNVACGTKEKTLNKVITHGRKKNTEEARFLGLRAL